MKPKKPKTNEPSLRTKLFKALESDFEMHGIETIKKLRETHPDRYIDITSRLIATIEPPVSGFAECNSLQEIGLKLLESVGVNANDATDDMVKQAMEANDAFIAKLEAIRDAGQGRIQ
jgi:hypothetical protein